MVAHGDWNVRKTVEEQTVGIISNVQKSRKSTSCDQREALHRDRSEEGYTESSCSCRCRCRQSWTRESQSEVWVEDLQEEGKVTMGGQWNTKYPTTNLARTFSQWICISGGDGTV